ncbi:hypothetical protein [Oceanobacillus rekensis]|uniref:hypothetical protein n=1 Tax=Oceanobacillus rekensis TaxID=937927 RepID=UPI000B43B11F|nr:hypothetical protein [Oceanobacillus rekensis]
MKLFIKLFSIGIISGLLLGGFLMLIEGFTGKTVYVLLMNIDYFPVVGSWEIDAITEFALHLMVSILLVFVIYFLFSKWNIVTRLIPYILMNALIGGMLYITTKLSERTPAIDDIVALIYWISGHILYGIIVWFLVVKLIVKK